MTTLYPKQCKHQVCKDKGQKRNGPGTGIEGSENKNNVLKTTPDESSVGSQWTKFYCVVLP